MDLTSVRNLAKNVVSKAETTIVMLDVNRFKMPEIVSLKSCHGKFLSAKLDGKADCNSDKAEASEKIQLVAAENGKYGLKSAHNKFLSAQPDGRAEWNCDGLNIWETWSIERQGESIALKSYHNKYLSAQPDGRIEVNRDVAKQWETFVVIG
jgi:hypothetical protein